MLPGLIDTPLVRAPITGDPEALAARHAAGPTGRMGTAWDVAHAAVFPASDRAAHVTAPRTVGARLLVTQTPGWGFDGPRVLLAGAAEPDADPLRQYARAMAGCGVEVLAPATASRRRELRAVSGRT